MIPITCLFTSSNPIVVSTARKIFFWSSGYFDSAFLKFTRQVLRTMLSKSLARAVENEERFVGLINIWKSACVWTVEAISHKHHTLEIGFGSFHSKTSRVFRSNPILFLNTVLYHSKDVTALCWLFEKRSNQKTVGVTCLDSYVSKAATKSRKGCCQA